MLPDRRGAWIDVQDSFRVSPGDYRVRLTYPGEPAREERAIVKADETISVTFRAR